ncbi:B-box zinc finger protein 22 isoform X1 [Solanum pennellii]|uniref:B-box zinc finger protein 22 isoform X1 n=1 Tax=Solanum pennellii TaxID=28526 RepID=A0ABM1H4L9_SOLPN|nr:B-box zinc finger protein 22 isoform X1 [Solanum pennellii]
MRRRCVGRVMRRFMLLISLLVNIREFLYLVLLHLCLCVISARIWFAYGMWRARLEVLNVKLWGTLFPYLAVLLGKRLRKQEETVGYFFCLEDRALLCRKCDIAIHTANPHVAAHQRFLLTGVKVGLEPVDPGGISSTGTSQSIQKVSEPESAPLSKRNVPVSLDVQFNKVLPTQVSGVEDFAPTKSLFAGGSAAGSMPQWQFDEFIGLSDFNQNYGYMDDGSSKADNGKLGGESDSSSILRVEDEELDGDECLGQVPDTSWAVPQVPSPPTASGLYWPKTYQNPFDSAVFVPDISYSPSSSLQQQPPSGTRLKRRRQC